MVNVKRTYCAQFMVGTTDCTLRVLYGSELTETFHTCGQIQIIDDIERRCKVQE